VQDHKLTGWKLDGLEESIAAAAGVSSGVSTTQSSETQTSESQDEDKARAALVRNFEFRLPLSWLLGSPGSGASSQTEADHKPGPAAIAATSRLRLRFSLWQNRLPVDALPVEGWIELQLVSEGELHSAM